MNTVRKKTLIFRGVSLVLGLLIIVGIEIALRAAYPELAAEADRLRTLESQDLGRRRSVIKIPDPDLLWRLRPGSPLSDTETLNSEGFRGPDFSKTKKPGMFRIVAIGDSRTFGFGVAENAETFCGRITQFLSDQEISDRIEIINLSVIGYSTCQGQRLLKKTVWNLHPDLLICWFGFNDTLFFHMTDQEAIQSNRIVRRTRSLLNHLHIYQLLRQTARDHQKKTHKTIQLNQRIVRRVPLPEFQKNVMEMATEASQHNCRILFLTSPVRPRIPMILNAKLIEFQDETGQTYQKLQNQYDLQGFWLMDATRFPGPESQLDELLVRFPELPILHYFKAVLLDDRGDTVAAEQEYERARELDTERAVIEAYNDSVRALSARSKTDVMDLPDIFREYPGAPLFVDDCHPNSNGHAIIAGAVIQFLSQLMTPDRVN